MDSSSFYKKILVFEQIISSGSTYVEITISGTWTLETIVNVFLSWKSQLVNDLQNRKKHS